MFGLKRDSRLFRFLKFLSALAQFVILLVLRLTKPGTPVIAWLVLLCLITLAGMGFVYTREYLRLERINRWYHAAHWTASIVCAVGGALCIVAALVWAIRWITLGQLSGDFVGILVIVAALVALVALLPLLALAAIGRLARDHEETRQHSQHLT